jgi:hypothetical protein
MRLATRDSVLRAVRSILVGRICCQTPTSSCWVLQSGFRSPFFDQKSMAGRSKLTAIDGLLGAPHSPCREWIIYADHSRLLALVWAGIGYHDDLAARALA